MCETCDALREENRYLRSLLAEREEFAFFSELRHRYSLSWQQAKLLSALYSSETGLSHAQLEEAIKHDHSIEYSSNIVQAVAKRVRAKLGYDVLITLTGQGYRLSPFGRQLIESVKESQNEQR